MKKETSASFNAQADTANCAIMIVEALLDFYPSVATTNPADKRLAEITIGFIKGLTPPRDEQSEICAYLADPEHFSSKSIMVIANILMLTIERKLIGQLEAVLPGLKRAAYGIPPERDEARKIILGAGKYFGNAYEYIKACSLTMSLKDEKTGAPLYESLIEIAKASYAASLTPASQQQAQPPKERPQRKPRAKRAPKP